MGMTQDSSYPYNYTIFPNILDDDSPQVSFEYDKSMGMAQDPKMELLYYIIIIRPQKLGVDPLKFSP